MSRNVTLDQAIDLLREKFAVAERDPHVFDPVAYALYYTWREVDEKNRKNRRNEK